MAETWGIAGDLESSYVLCDIEGAVFPPGDFVSKYIHRMPMSNVVLVVRQEQPRMRTLLNFDPVKCKFSLATKGNYELIRVLTPEESQKQRLASQKQSLSRADYGHETNVLVREPVSGVQATLLREMAFTLFFLATYLALLYTRRSVQDVYWLGDAVRSNVLAARFGPGLQYGYSNITRADQIWDVRRCHSNTPSVALTLHRPLAQSSSSKAPCPTSYLMEQGPTPPIRPTPSSEESTECSGQCACASSESRPNHVPFPMRSASRTGRRWAAWLPTAVTPAARQRLATMAQGASFPQCWASRGGARTALAHAPLLSMSHAEVLRSPQVQLLRLRGRPTAHRTHNVARRRPRLLRPIRLLHSPPAGQSPRVG